MKTTSIAKIISTIAATLALCSCGPVHIERPLTKEEAAVYPMGESTSGQGYLVGTFAYTGKHPGKFAKAFGHKDFRYDAYAVYLSNAAKSEIIGTIGDKDIYGSDTTFFAGTIMETAIKTDEGGFVPFLVPLEPGKYFFYNHMIHQNGYLAFTWKAPRDYRIEFEIEKGKATYVGEILATHLFKKVIGGIEGNGAHISSSNKLERDLEQLVEKYPFLKDMEMKEERTLLDFMNVYGPIPERTGPITK